MLIVALVFHHENRTALAEGYLALFLSGLALPVILSGMRRQGADLRAHASHIALQWFGFFALLGIVVGAISVALGVLTRGVAAEVYLPFFAAVDGVVCAFIRKDVERRSRQASLRTPKQI